VMPIIGMMMVGQVIFQAIGKVIQAIVTSLARSAIFLLPTVLIFPRFWGIDGIWAAFPITDVLTLVLTLGLMIPLLLDFRRRSKQQYFDMRNPDSVKNIPLKDFSPRTPGE